MNSVAGTVKLTRACDACVKSKRKCSLGCPTCDRCRTREIECVYRNQPVRNAQDIDFRERSQNAATRDRAFETVSNEVSLLFQDPRPRFIINIDQGTVIFTRHLAKRHVLNFGSRGGNVFIHSEIAKSQLATNLRTLCRQSSTIACRLHQQQLDAYEQLEYLVGSMVVKAQSAPNIYEMLFLVQSLILIQVVSLFILNANAPYRRLAERRQRVLGLWTGKLWSMAPSELPLSLSPREAFLLAESVRRTIMVSSEIQALWHVSQHFWIEHNLFLNTLPFERRATLWDMSEAKFDDAFQGGEQDIISWREYADMFAAGKVISFTSFEMMLLVGAMGKPAVEEKLRALNLVGE